MVRDRYNDTLQKAKGKPTGSDRAFFAGRRNGAVGEVGTKKGGVANGEGAAVAEGVTYSTTQAESQATSATPELAKRSRSSCVANSFFSVQYKRLVILHLAKFEPQPKK